MMTTDTANVLLRALPPCWTICMRITAWAINNALKYADVLKSTLYDNYGVCYNNGTGHPEMTSEDNGS